MPNLLTIISRETTLTIPTTVKQDQVSIWCLWSFYCQQVVNVSFNDPTNIIAQKTIIELYTLKCFYKLVTFHAKFLQIVNLDVVFNIEQFWLI